MLFATLHGWVVDLLFPWHQVIKSGKKWGQRVRSLVVFLKLSVHSYAVVRWVKEQVRVLCTVQATRKKHGTLNWVSRHWLCSLVRSSWNRFHMAGLETFPVGRVPANGSFCKGSAATLGAHPWVQCASPASPSIQSSVCFCPTILTAVFSLA